MTYDDWVKTIPENFRRDALWNFTTYRKAMFLADLAWFDTEKLIADSRQRHCLATH